jgi:hypothetical protein
MYIKTIICLANSRKPPSGRCIAGKEFDRNTVGGWLRPVSARSGHEVSEDERRYESGSKAQLLDIVAVPLTCPNPSGHQVENHILDAAYYWGKIGVATWAQVLSAADEYDPAFWANSQSTYHGLNDKVSEASTALAGSSLKLVVVNDLCIVVCREDGFQGAPARRRVRARFCVQECSYLLSVTDPEIEETYLTSGDGEYEIGTAALCISLVEVWNGFAFRVVASIITQTRCEA